MAAGFFTIEITHTTMKLAGAYISDDTYNKLVALAQRNHRSLANQCRHIYARALRGDLAVPDADPPAPPAPVVPPSAARAVVPKKRKRSRTSNKGSIGRECMRGLAELSMLILLLGTVFGWLWHHTPAQ